MSDLTNLVNAVEPAVDVSGASQTAGGLLKAARQSAGLHLAILSVSLKVPVRQLEALEANQFPNDQGLVFSRALASSVCRHLRIDPVPILALMPMSAHHLQVGRGLRHAYPSTDHTGRMRPLPAGLLGWMGWLILGMVLLISALIWWPNPSSWPRWIDELTAPAVSSNPSTSPNDAVQLGSPSLPSLLPQASAPQPLPSVALVPTPAGDPELLFSAKSTSWIEVREGGQRVLWTGVLNAGDTQRLNASRALFVVVGRADAIQVRFKGQVVDLTPYTQANVARFEVKP